MFIWFFSPFFLFCIENASTPTLCLYISCLSDHHFLSLSQSQCLEWRLPGLPVSFTIGLDDFQWFQIFEINFYIHSALENIQCIFFKKFAFLITKIYSTMNSILSYTRTCPHPSSKLLAPLVILPEFQSPVWGTELSTPLQTVTINTSSLIHYFFIFFLRKIRSNF